MSVTQNYRAGFIALLGPANVGKSTLLNALVGEKLAAVSPKAQTTRRRVVGIRTTDQAQLIFVDTPGFFARDGKRPKENALTKSLSREANDALEESDVRAYLIDSAKLVRENLQGGLPGWLPEEIARVEPAVIVLNKIDLIDRRALLPVIDLLSRLSSSERPFEIVPVSAEKRQGVKELETILTKFLPESPPHYGSDELTLSSERELAAETIREKLFLHLREELPYSVAVEIERFQRDGELLRVGALIMVERDSQKGIVIGEGGSMLKRIGTAARKELEQFHGQRVFLELHVKVVDDWTASEAGLRRTGQV